MWRLLKVNNRGVVSNSIKEQQDMLSKNPHNDFPVQVCLSKRILSENSETVTN